jgi:uncharacterized protein
VEPTRAVSLCVLAGQWAVCRLPPDASLPRPPASSLFYSVTRTADEVSVVCDVALTPPGARVQAPFTLLRVEGILDFSLVGILDGLTRPLATHGISVFAVSTFDTDYLFVPSSQATDACHALRAAGYRVSDPDMAPG